MSEYPALDIKSPDIGATMGTIFGLKSKQLGLEQQRQALQGQAAQVQQEQQTAQQRQAVGQFYNQFKPADHIGTDGTLDLDSALQDKNLDAAGDAKPAVIQSLLDVKKSQLAAKTQLANLNQGLVTQFGTTVGSLRTDPDVQNDTANGRAKVDSAISTFGQQSPDAARIAQLYGPSIQHVPRGQLGQSMKAIQLQAQSASEQQNQQNPQGGMVDTGPSIQPTNRNVQTGIVTAAGAPIQKGLAPTEQPNYAAQMATTKGQAEGITNRVSQVQAQANNTVQAQDALTRAKAILESPESPKTGANYESVRGLKNLMSSLGVDTKDTDDMNTLTKNLARFEAARATASGLGGTDAARELSHNGSPNTTLDNKALLGVVRQSLASEQVLSGYANLQSKTNDPQQLLQNEAAFRSIPHPIETREYMMSKSPAEADGYLKDHNLKHEDIANSAAQMKKLGVLQ